VLRLALPLVVSFLLRDAFGWVDMLFAAHLPGAAAQSDPAVAAIGLTGPFQFLMIACWVGTSNALTSRIAAALGAGQDAKIDQLLRAARRIIHALGGTFLLLATVIWFGAAHVGLEPETARQFQIYGTVLLAGSGLTTFWSILPDSIVKAHHDMRSVMWAGIASSILNVVLNAVFVYVFGWGIFGIALATVIGRLGGLAYALRIAARHERRRAEARGEDPALFARPVHTLLAMAIPSGLSFALMALEGFAVNAFLKEQPESTSNLAAFALIDRAGRTLSMPIIALGVAMLPLAARLWGSGDVDGIRRELRTCLRITAIYGLLIVVPLTLLASPAFARALLDQGSVDSARLALRWLPIGVIVGSPMFLLRTTFEGMQRPLPGLAGSAARALLLSVPLGYAGLLLAPHAGLVPLEGLVIGMSVGSGLASLGMAIWIHLWFKRCGRHLP